jgi:hypothetical protein
MALQTMKAAEKNVFTKFQVLQKHANELADRESSIASEKLQISKERLELQALKQKLAESKCSLCRIGEANQRQEHQIDQFMNSTGDGNFNELLEKFVSQRDTIPNLTDMSDNLLDPDLVMLKYDIKNSLATSNLGEFDF